MAQAPNLGKYPLATKIGVGFILAGLTALAYFMLFYGDVSDAIARQKREEQNLVAERAAVELSKTEYDKDLAELAERQQRQRDLNKILPETTEYPAFLSAVQGVANVSGVSLQGWAPMDEVVQKFFARVPMKLSIVGKFHQVAKFFYGVGQLDRIINVENIALTQPKVQGEEVQLKVDCLATAFHTIAAPAVGKAPAPAPGAKP